MATETASTVLCCFVLKLWQWCIEIPCWTSQTTVLQLPAVIRGTSAWHILLKVSLWIWGVLPATALFNVATSVVDQAGQLKNTVPHVTKCAKNSTKYNCKHCTGTVQYCRFETSTTVSQNTRSGFQNLAVVSWNTQCWCFADQTVVFWYTQRWCFEALTVVFWNIICWYFDTPTVVFWNIIWWCSEAPTVVFWNTVDWCSETPTVVFCNTQCWCFETQKVVAAQLPPLLVFRNTFF